MGTADSRSGERREIRFASVDDVLRDLESILLAPSAPTTGKWSAGQILEHVAKSIQFSYDGFPFAGPWALRVAGRLMKPALLGRPIKPGIRLRGKMLALAPESIVALESGAAELRTQLARIKSGERMTHASPVFGPMSHEDWVRLHLRHAELHMSFIHPARG